MAQWLRHHASKAGVLGSIPGMGLKSHISHGWVKQEIFNF